MKKLMLLAALVVAFFLPLTVMAEEATTEETIVETTAETTTAKPETMMYHVEVVDVSQGGVLLEKLSRGYELKTILGGQKVIDLHIKEVIEPAGYVVAKTALSKAWIEMEPDKATIYVHPAKKAVQVIHRLYRCDGTVKHDLLEVIEVPYLTELTKDTAKDILKSKIERVSGRGYVVKGLDVEPYEHIPYKVYDLDGHEVTPEASLDTVYVYYLDEACPVETEKADESKVDAAKVEVKPLAPEVVGSLPASLPATGDRSVLGFMLGAALLGVAVVIYKRHKLYKHY